VIESDGGLKHLAFFEELGKMDESDAGWRAVSAGLVTMRLVDRWIAVGSTSKLDSWSVSAARETIAQVADTTPTRRILTSIVDVMVACTATDMHALSPRLMAYGQALEYEAKWALAADVYSSIAAYTHPVDDADLAVGASLQLGFCRKTLGDLDLAAAGYRRAVELASAVNDRVGMLRGRLGDAKVTLDRGNLPSAEAALDAIINEARAHGFDDVQSRALVDRALAAGIRGEHSPAIRFSYDALVLSRSPRTRERILTNIATGFRYLGNTEIARNAYLVLAATAQEQFIRWNSLINLIELSASDGNELQFDRYRRELEAANLTPQLRATYLLHVGRGYLLLGQRSSAIDALEEALSFAAEHRLNQLSFEIDAALSDAKRAASPKPTTYQAEWNADLDDVVLAIDSMKQLAGVG